ncbi:hypothetical protein VTJ04DRAFT_7607 [Mycothermus thermophilus]|uniref:uncharacterized protein n=1 Tax=Humicola insolens TaxID=85995 RepID=UPI00374459D4
MGEYHHSLDIVSATWGTVDVTDKVRNLYAQSVREHTFVFQANDATFGTDPKIASPNKKALVLVYRVMLLTGSFSKFLAFAIRENSGGGLPHGSSAISPKPPAADINRVAIVKAFWYDKDVTEVVQALADKAEPGSTIKIGQAILEANGVSNPAGDTLKSISITWGYYSPVHRQIEQFFVSTGTDWDPAVIRQWPPPPRLIIWGASYGGIDFTNTLNDLIDQKTQTLDIDLEHLEDNWPNNHKSIVILYQFEGYPLHVKLATTAGETRVVLSHSYPYLPDRMKYFNTRERRPGHLNVLAVVWGGWFVNQHIFDRIEQEGGFSPTVSFFGFNRWTNVVKTATVFYQYGLTGDIRCATARESDIRVPLETRCALYRDPFTGTGFLTFPNPTDGFRLWLLRDGHKIWLSVAPNRKTLIPTSQEKDAAIFSFPSVMPDSTSQSTVQVLAVRISGDSTPSHSGYIRATVEGGPPAKSTTLEIVSDPKDATEAHYEFPPARLSTSILISFKTGRNTALQPFVLRYYTGLTGQQGAVQVVELGQPAPSETGSLAPGDKPRLDDSIFRFDFVIAKEPEPDMVAPTDVPLFNIAELLLHLLFHLPNAVFGWHCKLPSHAKYRVTNWIQKTPGARATLLADVDTIRLMYNNYQTSTSSDVGRFCWTAARFLIDDLDKNDLIWSFYRTIHDPNLQEGDFPINLMHFISLSNNKPLGSDFLVLRTAEVTALSYSALNYLEGTTRLVSGASKHHQNTIAAKFLGVDG